MTKEKHFPTFVNFSEVNYQFKFKTRKKEAKSSVVLIEPHTETEFYYDTKGKNLSSLTVMFSGRRLDRRLCIIRGFYLKISCLK